MDLPEYVTIEEVKRVCQELRISDWTELDNSKISSNEAKVILSEINVEEMNVDIDEFRRGLEVELEHGLRFKDANVTNNHPILTGKIVLAHAELEGDLMEAIMDDQCPELKSLYMRLANAKMILNQAEMQRLD